METIFSKAPINKRCPFLEEDEQRDTRRNMQFEEPMRFINPLQREERDMKRFPFLGEEEERETRRNLPFEDAVSRFINPLTRDIKRCPKKCCNKNRQFLDFLRRQQENVEDSCEEEQSMNFMQRPRKLRQIQQQEQGRMWYTVVPLHFPVRPEEVKVKLNPLCHILVIKATPVMPMKQFRESNTTSQQIQRLVTLPKTICMEKIQVKVTPRGELIVLAPYKNYQQGRQHGKNLLPPFLQSEEEERDTQQWISIPIHKLQGKSRQQPFYRRYQQRGTEELSQETSSSSSSESESESETETESEEERVNFPFRRTERYGETDSETESESESETESESENEMETLQTRTRCQQTIWKQLERINIRTSTKLMVKKFVQVLEKIFYPNMVVVKLLPAAESHTETEKQQLQLVVNIKFVDFTSEEIQVRMHHTQSVLIVEGKKMRQMGQFGAALKYVRREIQLPQVFNVEKVVYRVLENGCIRIKLPFSSTISTGTRTNFNSRAICGKQQQQQQHQLGFTDFARRVSYPHEMNFISEPVQTRRLCQQSRRNWKVLAQRCRPTTRRY